MTTNRLLLSVAARRLPRLAPTDFVWRAPPDDSSFRTDIGPSLSQSSGAPRRNVEFVRLAVLAYLVDRTTPRKPRRWLRNLNLQIPVWDRGPWVEVAGDLEALLSFLTNDRWSLDFVGSRTPSPASTGAAPEGPAVALFSGGADSLAGALIAERQLESPPILVSHRDWSILTGVQKELISELTDLWGQAPPTLSAVVGRSGRQIGSGLPFGREATSRARSVLFIALGLAVAAANGVPLLIPENGFASLNPPMGGERRGALSTRTTHPWYLSELGRILNQVGAHAAIENPFADQTKGQMFARVAADLGSEQASILLSESHSCGRGDVRFAGVADAKHCGVCFGCLVRRAAFRGAGLDDRTVYIVQDLTTPVRAFDWYIEKRRRDLEAARYAAYRDVDIAEVVRNLPPTTDPAAAVDTAARGLKELGQLVL